MIIFTRDRAWFCRARVAHTFDKLGGMFVETNEWAVWIVRFLVQREHVFHVIDELDALTGRDYLLLRSVRLELVF